MNFVAITLLSMQIPLILVYGSSVAEDQTKVQQHVWETFEKLHGSYLSDLVSSPSTLVTMTNNGPQPLVGEVIKKKTATMVCSSYGHGHAIGKCSILSIDTPSLISSDVIP